MIRIAIVEDEQENAEILTQYLKQYENETNQQFQIKHYRDGIDFVDEFISQYEIILMDIKMKFLNGMESAKRIRHRDKNVIIVFITNMAEYAIQGYDVDARGFIMKPISYRAFSQQMNKVCEEIEGRKEEFMTIQFQGGMRNISLREISYIENRAHYLYIHTSRETISFYCTIKEMEKKLEGKDFSRCNSGFIVNLRNVRGVKNNMVFVGTEALNISRSRKNQFMEQLTEYIGGGKYV